MTGSGPDDAGEPAPRQHPAPRSEPERPPARRLLVVPSPDPVRLARACAGLGAAGHVVPADGACVVVLDPAADADAALPRLSRVLGRAPVLLLRSDGGQVRAERWVRGALADAPQAGLVVAALPDIVHRLLVGAVDPASVPGAVRTGLVPRATGDAGRPADDPRRPERRRRADRVAAVVVAVVAALLAVAEGARAATADGSWAVVVLAVVVAAGAGLLAVRLRRRHEVSAPPADRSPGAGNGAPAS